MMQSSERFIKQTKYILAIAFVFFLGFLMGRFTQICQKEYYAVEDGYNFVQSLSSIESAGELNYEQYRINIYEESSWEISPCYRYQIIDWKSFKPMMDGPLKTPEFVLICSGDWPVAAVVTKEYPKEVLIIYDSETFEYCDNWSTDDEVVIKRMLLKFCIQTNDYSYYMKSKNGVIRIDPNESKKMGIANN